MMKAAKLGWVGAGGGQEQARSRPGANQEQSRNRAGAELSRVEQGRKRAGAGQELGGCRVAAWKEQGRSRTEQGRKREGAGQELGRSWEGAGYELGRERAGQKLELGRNKVSVKCDQASPWLVRAGAEICILNDTRIDKSLKNKVSVQLFHL